MLSADADLGRARLLPPDRVSRPCRSICFLRGPLFTLAIKGAFLNVGRRDRPLSTILTDEMMSDFAMFTSTFYVTAYARL